MEYENLNKSLCEELFGGEVNVAEEPLEDKSQARRHRDEMHRNHGVELVRLQKRVVALQEMYQITRNKLICMRRILDRAPSATIESRSNLREKRAMRHFFSSFHQFFNFCNTKQ